MTYTEAIGGLDWIELLNWTAVMMTITGAVAFILLKRLRAIAFKRSLFDKANERSSHEGLIPRLGGLVFLPMLLLMSFVLTLVRDQSWAQDIATLQLWGVTPLIMSAAVGTIALFVMGFEDDLIAMHYRPKFAIQAFACIMLLLVGDSYEFVGLLGLEFLPMPLQYGLSFLILLGIINAFNLIDGIDGLAAGISVLAFIVYGSIFTWVGAMSYAFICMIMLGILIAFLHVNLMGKVELRSKMFMGDTGSQMLGYILAGMSLALAGSDHGNIGTGHMPIIAVISPLIVPCFDLLWVFALRLIAGKNPFNADRSHIHHRIMDIGLRPRQALVILLMLSFLFVLLNMELYYINATALLGINLLLWIVFNLVLNRLKKVNHR